MLREGVEEVEELDTMTREWLKGQGANRMGKSY